MLPKISPTTRSTTKSKMTAFIAATSFEIEILRWHPLPLFLWNRSIQLENHFFQRSHVIVVHRHGILARPIFFTIVIYARERAGTRPGRVLDPRKKLAGILGCILAQSNQRVAQ